ncbi:MAG: hypothetical protein QM817_11790 [Archangium sp.]
MLPLLASVVLTVADGGTSYALTAVEAGDQLTYSLNGADTLTLRACAKSAKSVTVAVSLERDGGAPPGTWLLDRVVIEVPVAPLEKPKPWLGQSHEATTFTAAGRKFESCLKHGLFHPTAHGPSGFVHRCEARELLLGGGLVVQDLSWLGIIGGRGSSVVKLTQIAKNAAPCPAEWPHATLNGRWKWKAERRVVSESYKAGGALIRRTEDDWSSDEFLLDFLVHAAQAIPRQTPTPQKATIAGQEVELLTVMRPNETFARWAAPTAMPDAPLALRIEMLLDVLEWSSR